MRLMPLQSLGRVRSIQSYPRGCFHILSSWHWSHNEAILWRQGLLLLYIYIYIYIFIYIIRTFQGIQLIWNPPMKIPWRHRTHLESPIKSGVPKQQSQEKAIVQTKWPKGHHFHGWRIHSSSMGANLMFYVNLIWRHSISTVVAWVSQWERIPVFATAVYISLIQPADTCICPLPYLR